MLREQYFIEKRPLECTQACLMPLHRFAHLLWDFLVIIFPLWDLIVIFPESNCIYMKHLDVSYAYNNEWLIVLLWMIADCDWNTLYTCSKYFLLNHGLFYDAIWMDGSKVLLVLLHLLLLLIVFHILWHDVCGNHSHHPACRNLHICILWTLQSLFWLFDPKTCK